MARSIGLSLAVQALGKARTAGTNLGNELPITLLPGREVGAAESAADQAKGGSAMATVELLMIGVVFTTGVITGVVFLVSLASRREDRREKLSREAPDGWSLAGRVLTGLYVRRPGDDSPKLRHPDDDPTEYSGPPRSGPRE
jgi:hypothetical protein